RRAARAKQTRPLGSAPRSRWLGRPRRQSRPGLWAAPASRWLGRPRRQSRPGLWAGPRSRWLGRPRRQSRPGLWAAPRSRWLGRPRRQSRPGLWAAPPSRRLEARAEGLTVTTTPARTTIDPVTLTIINNNFVNVCREMGITMARTAFSPIFNEGL